MKITKNYIKELVFKSIKEQKMLKESSDSSDKEFDALFSKMVPSNGPADTVEGEMLRALTRVWYRYTNDGDYFWRGYGKETALNSVKWLTTSSPLKSQMRSIFAEIKRKVSPMIVKDKWGGEHKNMFEDNDPYMIGLNKASKIIVDYVKSKKGKFEPNKSDSR
jgi:hypothetical protein